MYCRNLNFSRCALYLSCFQGSSYYLGLGPFRQLVGFLCWKQCVQGNELCSKEFGFFLGQLSVLMITGIGNKISNFATGSFAFCFKNNIKNISESLLPLIISAKWIVMIRLKKFERPHRPWNLRSNKYCFSPTTQLVSFLVPSGKGTWL